MNNVDFTFPNVMHALSAALHQELICPEDVVITLPRQEWWKLWNAIERKYKHILAYDGRGGLKDEFQYMGFCFRPDDLRDKRHERTR